MRYPNLALLLLLGLLPPVGKAQTIYARQHDLLVQAIRSGHAEGVMSGHLAERFQSQFHSGGAVLATADVERHYTRPDCKRLHLAYTTRDVITAAGRRDLILHLRLNYCLDGGPPPSGLEERP